MYSRLDVANGKLPVMDENVYSLKSGQFDDGTWGIAVVMLYGAYYYKLNLDLLD